MNWFVSAVIGSFGAIAWIFAVLAFAYAADLRIAGRIRGSREIAALGGLLVVAGCGLAGVALAMRAAA